MIILASNSPRRRELLAHITRDFTVQGTDVNESLPAGIAPAAAVEQLSLRKALPLNNGAQIVIGADTVVAVDGMILGKPADEAEARQMLARLSGRWHSVFTGVSLVQGERHLTFSCETRQGRRLRYTGLWQPTGAGNSGRLLQCGGLAGKPIVPGVE